MPRKRSMKINDKELTGLAKAAIDTVQDLIRDVVGDIQQRKEGRPDDTPTPELIEMYQRLNDISLLTLREAFRLDADRLASPAKEFCLRRVEVIGLVFAQRMEDGGDTVQ